MVRNVAGMEMLLSVLLVLCRGMWRAGDQIRDIINRVE